MRNLSLKSILLLISLGIASNAFALSPAKVTNIPKLPLLYVLVAHHGTLEKVGKNHYRLILKNMDHYVTYFSESPKRVSGIIATPVFASQWMKAENNKHPLNAAINAARKSNLHAIFHGKSKQFNSSLELLNANYNSKHHTLSFNVKPMPGNHIQGNKIHFDDMSLFIDSVCLSCVGE